jgi:hypothetical protein
MLLDMMNQVFVLSPRGENIYIPGSPDATGFDAAYEVLQNAVSTAYVYNPSGVDEPIAFEQNGDTADLYIGQWVFRDKILFDADGRALFPARVLSEALGYQVEWDASTASFIIMKDDSLIAAQSVEDSYTAVALKDATEITCAMIDGSVYVDLDFVVNTLNCAVSRHEANRAVTVQARSL